MGPYKFRKRPRQLNAPTLLPSRWDIWLPRIAHASQPLLLFLQIAALILGVLAFIYTVKPVFQNQLLSEQAAKLTIEKELLERQVGDLNSTRAAIEAEIGDQRLRLEAEKSKNDSLARAASAATMKAKQLEEVARTVAAIAEADRNEKLRNLDSANWQLALHLLSNALLHKSLSDRNVDRDKADLQQELKEAAKSWPQPKKIMLEAVAHARSRAQGIPGEYFDKLQAEVEADQTTLVCTPPDFAALQQQLIQLLEKGEASAEAETLKYLSDLEEEYKARNEQVLLTDEFKNAIRSSNRLGQKLRAEAQVREVVWKSRLDCKLVPWNLLKQMYARKGIEYQ